ncbi:MAG: hypothetical protein MI862_19510, partial [Desulfobacterales bacterium]|nr:hypothetical protein [Desulfobacterales bacterium]
VSKVSSGALLSSGNCRTGFGGSGGIGALINYSGNDEYIAERYASKGSMLVDYKEGRLINRNKAQGASAGRRADISDGSAWAGGLGVIMDIEGDDIYTSGDYSLGIGYWFGTGICFDRNGNDTYNSNFNTQGCDIHFSIGALIDENGDDHHNLYEEKLNGKSGIEAGGGGLGYGWDSGAGILINKQGNDVYKSQWKSFGYSEIRSQAFFIDEFGEDTYIYGQLKDGFGRANTLDLYNKPDLRTIYFYKEHCSNLGMFLDAGGEDNYHYWNFSTSSDQLNEVKWFKNNTFWMNPDLIEANTGKNYGIGMDVEGGTIRLFDTWGDW